jgi:hypothetical protein
MLSSLKKREPKLNIPSISCIPPPRDSPNPNIEFTLLSESKKEISVFFPMEFMNITAWKTDSSFDLPPGRCTRMEVASGLSSYIGVNKRNGESISEQICHFK